MGVRVGVCEDDAGLRSVLSRALAAEGFEVRTTSNGREAVRVFSGQRAGAGGARTCPMPMARRLPGAARRRGSRPSRAATAGASCSDCRACARRTLFVVFAALPLSCGHAKPGRPLSLAARAAGGGVSHRVTIVMEIKESGQIIGAPDAAFVNRLARRYGLATASYGFRHPLLPNYLALTSGSTHGIDSDCTSCRVSAHNVVDQLEVAGISWKAYMEDMPRPCFGSAGAGGYAKSTISSPLRRRRRERRALPEGRLVRPARRGPAARFAGTYVFISPNLCDGMHECGVPARGGRSRTPSACSRLGAARDPRHGDLTGLFRRVPRIR